ncbi:unnamed protein product, partial [marine sediment metagenome]
DALNLVKKYSYKELMYLTQGLLFWLEDNAKNVRDKNTFTVAKRQVEIVIDRKEREKNK